MHYDCSFPERQFDARRPNWTGTHVAGEFEASVDEKAHGLIIVCVGGGRVDGASF